MLFFHMQSQLSPHSWVSAFFCWLVIAVITSAENSTHAGGVSEFVLFCYPLCAFCKLIRLNCLAFWHALASQRVNLFPVLFVQKEKVYLYFIFPILILELAYQVPQKIFAGSLNRNRVYRLFWEKLIPKKYWVFLAMNAVYLFHLFRSPLTCSFPSVSNTSMKTLHICIRFIPCYFLGL